MADDTTLWRDWLTRHGLALVLFARQWTASVADAEDAVQDGFIRFWQARSRARGGIGYLYACVRTAAMDLSRARRRREKNEARFAMPATADTSAFSAEDAEFAAAVESSLTKIAPEQREVLVMKIWGGLTFAEIAETLSISPNTAASRYRYALERLENELSEEVTRE